MAGLLGPKGLPAGVVTRIKAEFARLARNREFERQFRMVGTDVVYRAPQQWDAFRRVERDTWAKVVRETGAQVN